MLRSLVCKSLKDWDLKLPYAKFAYNGALSNATLHSAFECMYGVHPFTHIDLLHIPNISGESHDVELEPKQRRRCIKRLGDILRRKMQLTK